MGQLVCAYALAREGAQRLAGILGTGGYEVRKRKALYRVLPYFVW